MHKIDYLLYFRVNFVQIFVLTFLEKLLPKKISFEINWPLKLPRPAMGKDLYSNTSIREDAPWQLQQVQDSVNHLSDALALIRTSKSEYG